MIARQSVTTWNAASGMWSILTRDRVPSRRSFQVPARPAATASRSIHDAERDVVAELRPMLLRSERRDDAGTDDTAQMDTTDTVLEPQLVERLTDGQVRAGEHRTALRRKRLEVLGDAEVVDAPFVFLALCHGRTRW